MHYLPDVDTLVEPLANLSDGGSGYAPLLVYDWNELYFQKRDRVKRLSTGGCRATSPLVALLALTPG